MLGLFRSSCGSDHSRNSRGGRAIAARVLPQLGRDRDEHDTPPVAASNRQYRPILLKAAIRRGGELRALEMLSIAKLNSRGIGHRQPTPKDLPLMLSHRSPIISILEARFRSTGVQIARYHGRCKTRMQTANVSHTKANGKIVLAQTALSASGTNLSQKASPGRVSR